MTSMFLIAMAAPSQGAPSALVQLLPFALVLAIFYFIILLPMKRKQQKVADFLAGLKEGDKVVTSGRHLRHDHQDQRPGTPAPDSGARARRRLT